MGGSCRYSMIRYGKCHSTLAKPCTNISLCSMLWCKSIWQATRKMAFGHTTNFLHDPPPNPMDTWIIVSTLTVLQRSCAKMPYPQLQQAAPFFRSQAAINGEFKEISLIDYRGQYVVLFFYPLDFTFVCPTEIVAFSDAASKFRAINCEVSHPGWSFRDFTSMAVMVIFYVNGCHGLQPLFWGLGFQAVAKLRQGTRLAPQLMVGSMVVCNG